MIHLIRAHPAAGEQPQPVFRQLADGIAVELLPAGDQRVIPADLIHEIRRIPGGHIQQLCLKAVFLEHIRRRLPQNPRVLFA